jgi:hypothetical protein
MALKLLETEFIKDAWSAKHHYQTWLCLRIWRYAESVIVFANLSLGTVTKF